MRFTRLLHISRPRFWLYEAGTFLVGVAAAYAAGVELWALFSPAVVALFVYFLFPANLLIYGINDIFDYETDKLNPKKQGYEALVEPHERRPLWIAIVGTSLPFAFALIGASPEASIALAVFVFFAVCYSAPPIRAKARPVLDSIFSAGHYVATGVCGYYLAGGTGFDPLPILAGMSWAMAMHAFSAVPDIAADHEAGVPTIATALGGRATIALCFALYALAAAIGCSYLGIAAALLGIPYLTIMALSYRSLDDALFRLYTYFPTLNALTGMAIFFLVALQ